MHPPWYLYLPVHTRFTPPNLSPPSLLDWPHQFPPEARITSRPSRTIDTDLFMFLTRLYQLYHGVIYVVPILPCSCISLTYISLTMNLVPIFLLPYTLYNVAYRYFTLYLKPSSHCILYLKIYYFLSKHNLRWHFFSEFLPYSQTIALHLLELEVNFSK